MSKVRVDVTIKGHYEFDKTNMQEVYGTTDLEEALKADMEGWSGDPDMLLDAIWGNAVTTLECDDVKVVNESEEPEKVETYSLPDEPTVNPYQWPET